MKKTILLLFVFLLLSCGKKPVTIGIAWNGGISSEFFRAVTHAAEATGARVVALEPVRPNLPVQTDTNGILLPETAHALLAGDGIESDVAAVMEGIDAVVFPGGQDISPTLFARPEPWHGILAERDYAAERDVSDFLLMRWCLDHDIPLLAICRGFQVLSVLAGANLVQDIPGWLQDKGIDAPLAHKGHNGESADYAIHDIAVRPGSLLHRVVGTDTLRGCASWHHQGVVTLEGTPLLTDATEDTGGASFVEAAEYPGKRFVLGVQFHPEIAFVENWDSALPRSAYMDSTVTLQFFRALYQAVP